MSIRVMSAVWSMDLPDSDKIVLLALADCANDEGHCWPSMRSLSAKCSKSDRTIQFSIKRLVADGHLTRREVPGKGCNYTVHPRRDAAPEITSPPKGATQTPEAASGKPSRTVNTEAKASLQRVVEAYNSMAKEQGLPESIYQDASLRQSIRLRLKEIGEGRLLEAIHKLGCNRWLKGEGRDSSWKPTLAWLMAPSKLRMVLEGGYGEEERKRTQTPADEIREYENRAEWFRKFDREEDAKRCLAYAEQLRSAAAQDTGRRFTPVSVGDAIRVPGGLGTQ